MFRRLNPLSRALCVPLLLFTVAVSAAGCATGKLGDIVVNGVANPISNTRFGSIEAGYGLAVVGANTYIANYRKGNRCTAMRQESITNPCSRRSIAEKMQESIKTAQRAVGKARTLLVNNPQLDPSELLDAAESAVGLLTDLVRSN